MTLCPVAIAVGCKKCPAVGFCFLKEVVGNFKPDADEAATTKPPAGESASGKPRAE